MEQQVFSTTANPTVVIEAVQGDLHIMGWEQSDVLARARSEHDLTATQEGDLVRVSCNGECVMRVPQDASLRIQLVNGDARVKSMRGPLTIGRVAGDLGIQGAGATEVDTAQGDCLARAIQGDFKANHVTGDASVREVRGQLTVSAAAGDLRLADIAGGVTATAGGDASVSLSPAPGQAYRVSAGGDLVLRVPPGASARVSMTSNANQIRVRAAGVPNGAGKGSRQVTLGAGDAEVVLAAGGDILLAEDAESRPADDIGVRLEAEFTSMGEAIGRRAQEAAERAARHAEAHAQRAAQKAARKAERIAERVAREAERQTRDWPFSRRGFPFEAPFGSPSPRPGPRPAPQPAPRPAPQPVTDEERLAVLRMVEQKKITVEQAEQLLAALEGRTA
jgi:hypothetical protein